MSLLDALLLDPVRTDIWLAVRLAPGMSQSDAIGGSGTAQDPYNAGVVGTSTYPVLSISSITFSAGTAEVTTTTDHGFLAGYRILVWGVTGGNAAFYNGVFSITPSPSDTKKFTFTVVTAGTPTTATGTFSCQRNPFLFDDSLVLSLRNNLGFLKTLRLGPQELGPVATAAIKTLRETAQTSLPDDPPDDLIGRIRELEIQLAKLKSEAGISQPEVLS